VAWLLIVYLTGFVLSLGFIVGASYARHGRLRRGFWWIVADSALWFLAWPAMFREAYRRVFPTP
jgi:hypothetical protein